jgi:2-dehydro-3-deoxygalactonokinase
MNDLRIMGDWGSTRLRLWLVEGEAVRSRRDGPGIVGLESPAAGVLRAAVSPWIEAGVPARIALCGMAGARGALREVPYGECPLSLQRWRDGMVRIEIDGVAIRLAAGCADGTRDVMRGEETQLFGACALRPRLASGNHLVVLPGTHSKWAWLKDGLIASFRTVPTGELFALLASSSLLGGGGEEQSADETRGFAEGVTRAAAAPGVLRELFVARAAQLREGRSASWSKGYLSGLLIAGEVAEMGAAGLLPQRVTLVGDPALTSRYRSALAAFDVKTDALDGDACAIAGLRLLDEND